MTTVLGFFLYFMYLGKHQQRVPQRMIELMASITKLCLSARENCDIYGFIWIRRISDYIKLNACYCVLFSSRIRVTVRVRIGFGCLVG